jgi:AraC family transcriptional regulator, transcriptional activator of pobA
MDTRNEHRKLLHLWSMRKIETIEEFYERKFDVVPENLHSEMGHFNVFNVEPFPDGIPRPVPYSRRDYFKIMQVTGNYNIHYADETIEIQKHALTFSNPQIPYSCEHLERIKSGQFCVFTSAFFHEFGDLKRYTVFQPGGTHIFELTDAQVPAVKAIFGHMFEEIHSDYIHKYDLLHNLVFELIHFAMKLPSAKVGKPAMNASQRIASLFMELLERQFPIDDNHQNINLRSASDFAQQLNVHVNHLNRSVKETTEKTTSRIIGERILREAKILLKHSAWNVSEIAYALGFNEVTHFDNFFKKHVQLSPMKFRNGR